MKAFSINTRDDQKSRDISKIIKEKLISRGFIYNKEKPELIISIGGDGTFLGTVQKYIDVIDSVKFIGVRTGTLGFYTDYLDNDIDLLIDDICKGEIYQICQMPLLEVTLKFKNECKVFYALNEMRIENNLNTLILEVSIDDLLLQNYRGNGMIVCTPTGSTAYNYSLGGAIIDHKAAVMELTEIAAIHHNKYRSLGASLILNNDRVIKFRAGDFNKALIGLDNYIIDDKNVEEVEVRLSNRFVNVIRYRANFFINRIRKTFIVE